MFKVTISGEVDEEEEYIKRILALENFAKTIADVDDPVTAAEILMDLGNTHPVSVSVEKLPL